jgi:4'-phosphopantetheinyl transferase
MARILLGLYLGCPPRAVRFGYARHGKPYVICADRQVGLRFNASRTKDLAIFAVSAEREVGIDIERLNLDHASVDAVTQALTERERAVLNPLPSKIERYAGCLNAWARKEAYLKARGVGLMISPADVDTEPKSGRIYLYGKWQQRWRVYDLAVGDCYSAAVAAEGEHWRIVLREFKMLKIVHPALANPVIG